MNSDITIGLRLDPLDVLFFRDGRPFEAGIRATSTQPLPQTLAGALRTHVLTAAKCDFGRLGSAVSGGQSFARALGAQSAELGGLAGLASRGPWFARYDRPLVPMPASLHRFGKKQTEGSFVCLKPLEVAPPGWRALLPRPLWTNEGGRTERATGWITLEGIGDFLAGRAPDPKHAVKSEELFTSDSRTGIVIGAETWTTEESLIYAADYLALNKGISLYAEITGPADALDRAFSGRSETLALGGQGRRVRATRLDRPARWPARPSAGTGRRLLVLTTPGLFAEGWRPGRVKPIAAAVPGHVAFSGWDLARNGPKPTRFAAAAGSVFFFDEPPDLDGPSLCDEADDRLVGWGSYLEGIW